MCPPITKYAVNTILSRPWSTEELTADKALHICVCGDISGGPAGSGRSDISGGSGSGGGAGGSLGRTGDISGRPAGSGCSRGVGGGGREKPPFLCCLGWPVLEQSCNWASSKAAFTGVLVSIAVVLQHYRRTVSTLLPCRQNEAKLTPLTSFCCFFLSFF